MARTDGSGAALVAAASALVLAAGVVMGLLILSDVGQPVLAFLMLSVVPGLLGYTGLARTGYLPWRTVEGDPMADLKQRYAAGDVDDDELERGVDAMVGPDGDVAAGERDGARQ